MRTALLAFGLCFAAPASAMAAEPFEFDPAGALVPGSGEGTDDETIYVPGMRFPIEEGPAYANSQVYRNGGNNGPGGSQCDAVNYDYPWQDNFCETRQWDMPLCPAGQGHQGQDIRAATCEADVHYTVAAGDGKVSTLSGYLLYVTADDGTRFEYLHGNLPEVVIGEEVLKGQRLHRVSNEFDGTPTTIHLHYNLRQDVAGYGHIFVPPYMTLVRAYRRLIGELSAELPVGAIDGGDCDVLEGWAQDPDAPTSPVLVQMYFDGPRDDPDAVGVELWADGPREDLCETLGSCDQGFAVEVPLSRRDGTAHAVHTYAIDPEDELDAEISVVSLNCEPPPIPGGVLREVASPEVLAAWTLSPFWDGLDVEADVIDDRPVGDGFPPGPELLRGGDELFVVDGEILRPISEAAAARWELDAEAATAASDEQLAGYTVGPVWPNRPFLLLHDGRTHAVDTCPDDLDDPACADPEGGTSGTGSGGPGGTTGDGNGSSGGTSAGAGTDSAGAEGDEDGSSGCTCTAARGSDAPPAWLWLGVLVGLRRRRAKR